MTTRIAIGGFAIVTLSPLTPEPGTTIAWHYASVQIIAARYLGGAPHISFNVLQVFVTIDPSIVQPFLAVQQKKLRAVIPGFERL